MKSGRTSFVVVEVSPRRRVYARVDDVSERFGQAWSRDRVAAAKAAGLEVVALDFYGFRVRDTDRAIVAGLWPEKK